MERVFNFSAGPSAIPEDVLLKAQKDLFNYPGAGCSVLEMSHRSASFQEIIDNAEATLRRIMNIPEDYAVLFMQGGATLQFSAVAMNLAKQGQKSAYAVTGQFSKKAFAEGKRWTDAVKVADSSDENFSYIPDITADMVPQTAAYFHICANNTIYGTTWWRKPQTGAVPFVADWSSAILGANIKVEDHDLIYAGAQKNMGPSGMAVVIAKK
ncbi:MAG: 3-phosphoserine/phosphohydroxythreonine transaminase, partial [Firmicutes bacterium]|nr:3-phosphoserine/phosphohydroxythreonine transaminase [Bacillota bacterium]